MVPTKKKADENLSDTELEEGKVFKQRLGMDDTSSFVNLDLFKINSSDQKEIKIGLRERNRSCGSPLLQEKSSKSVFYQHKQRKQNLSMYLGDANISTIENQIQNDSSIVHGLSQVLKKRPRKP